MANYIENLNDLNMQAIKIVAGISFDGIIMQVIAISAGLPSDDRVVHIYDIDCNLPLCAPARYRKGQWIGALTGDILEGLSDKACWGESVFSTAASAGRTSNITGERIQGD